MKINTPEIVMAYFNLSSESFDSLPRGLSSELHSIIDENTKLLAVVKRLADNKSGENIVYNNLRKEARTLVTKHSK